MNNSTIFPQRESAEATSGRRVLSLLRQKTQWRSDKMASQPSQPNSQRTITSRRHHQPTAISKGRKSTTVAALSSSSIPSQIHSLGLTSPPGEFAKVLERDMDDLRNELSRATSSILVKQRVTEADSSRKRPRGVEPPSSSIMPTSSVATAQHLESLWLRFKELQQTVAKVEPSIVACRANTQACLTMLLSVTKLTVLQPAPLLGRCDNPPLRELDIFENW